MSTTDQQPGIITINETWQSEIRFQWSEKLEPLTTSFIRDEDVNTLTKRCNSLLKRCEELEQILLGFSQR